MQKCGYYPGIPGFFQVYPQNTRYFADFGPKTASDTAQSPPKMTNSTEFPRGFPRKLEGVVGKRAGNTERKPGRVREETLGQANRP